MPSTAAARTTVPPAGESRAIRAATASRTPSGSPFSSVTSAADSSRPSSPTKNGLPPVRRCTAAATRAGTVNPATASSCALTSGSLSPVRRIRSTAGSLARLPNASRSAARPAVSVLR